MLISYSPTGAYVKDGILRRSRLLIVLTWQFSERRNCQVKHRIEEKGIGVLE